MLSLLTFQVYYLLSSFLALTSLKAFRQERKQGVGHLLKTIKTHKICNSNGHLK